MSEWNPPKWQPDSGSDRCPNDCPMMTGGAGLYQCHWNGDRKLRTRRGVIPLKVDACFCYPHKRKAIELRDQFLGLPTPLRIDLAMVLRDYKSTAKDEAGNLESDTAARIRRLWFTVTGETPAERGEATP